MFAPYFSLIRRMVINYTYWSQCNEIDLFIDLFFKIAWCLALIIGEPNRIYLNDKSLQIDF